MNDSLKHDFNLPPEQQAIRGKCFHPAGGFIEFTEDEVEQSIPARFEKMVELHTGRLAIRMGGKEFTYAELNHAANRVARSLVSVDGTKSGPILLISEHGAEAIVAALAILKAGKILVAADPSFPPERIELISEDCQAGAILATHANVHLANTLARSSRPVIIIEEALDSSSSENLNVPLSGKSPAQIVYTSGSTGKAKGVIRNHARMVYSASLLINTIQIYPTDRLLLVYTLSFGAGLTELLKGLLAGAALFPFAVKKTGLVELAGFLKEQGITYFSSSPSTFRCFVEGLGREEVFSNVRVVELGSEPLTRHEVRLYRKHFSATSTLVNRYASSETGTVCLFFVNSTTPIDTPVVPVGYPVSGKQVLILDEDGCQVKPDQVGEIAVRSRYLSSGYWGNPELTRTKFLTAADGEEFPVYLTGDIGQMLASGCLHYLGRKDDQVKIRGFRIQPSEIQAVLLENSNVKDAAVVAWERESGERVLAAYVVPRQASQATSSELQKFLRARLPDFMVPASIVLLETLPMINGKLDRKSLPAPGRARPELSTAYTAPEGDVETTLARIWAEVIGVEPVGVHDNFFDLGGHSLAASRVNSRLIQAFKLELPVKVLFNSPTVAEMAKIIMQHQADQASEEELASMLCEVESISEDEAQKLVAAENSRSGGAVGRE